MVFVRTFKKNPQRTRVESKNHCGYSVNTESHYEDVFLCDLELHFEGMCKVHYFDTRANSLRSRNTRVAIGVKHVFQLQINSVHVDKEIPVTSVLHQFPPTHHLIFIMHLFCF